LSRRQPARLSRRLVLVSALGGLTGLTGCFDRFDGPQSQTAVPPGLPGASPAGAGGPLGMGSVKVALVLPLSAGGQSSQIALQLKNAAELALQSYQGADLQLVVKDDQGTTEGGEAAASQAIAEGAQLIIGPLNAVSARGAAGPARRAGVPMITFTTDVSIATRGVYLIGFLPNADVERVIAYAASQGRRSVAGLIPDDAYGSLAEAAFRQSAATNNLRVQAIERYKSDLSDIQTPARNIAALGGQIDCVFLPDGGANAGRVAQALSVAGLDRGKVKLLGTGRWNDRAAYADPGLAGGWFPAPNPARVEEFNGKYRAAYGGDPVSLAILGFEAVYLAAALAARGGDKPFRDEVLLSRSGFLGNTGLFRFRADGISERSLSVMEIANGGAREVGPAAGQFPAGT
jgi:ABC-type branched-subunit amino acid transport system substrate-binding protein